MLRYLLSRLFIEYFPNFVSSYIFVSSIKTLMNYLGNTNNRQRPIFNVVFSYKCISNPMQCAHSTYPKRGTLFNYP